MDSCFELQSLNCAHLSSCKGVQVLGKYELSSFSPKGRTLTLQEHLLYLTTSTAQTHPNDCFLYGLICTYLSFFLNQGFLDDENRFAFIFKVFQMF